MLIYSLKYQNKESGKILKNEAAEPYLEPCQISMMERFCENTTAKSFIIDVWYGSKYTPEVVQDSKINLKWMNTKMMEKTLHFFNVDLPEDISTRGYANQRYPILTCNLQLHLKRDAGIYRFKWVLQKKFGNTLIMEILLWTGIERGILWNMENQHSYYNKDISWSPQLFQKTDNVRENVSFRAIDRKLTLNLIVIFNSFTYT